MEIWALLMLLLIPVDLGGAWGGTPLNVDAGEVQAMDDGFPIPPK